MSAPTDFKTLSRLGTAAGTPTGAGRRQASASWRPRLARRRGRRSGRGLLAMVGLQLPSVRGMAITGVVALIGLFALGTAAQTQLNAPLTAASTLPGLDPLLEASLLSGGTQMAATGARTLIPGGGATAGVVEVPQAFAAVGDLALTLPSQRHRGLTFTEADAVDMLALTPVGTMVENGNPEGYAPTQTFEGPDYTVGEPVTGVRPATGLARILLAPGTSILSPVTGRVVAVEEYSSADGQRDWRVVLQPSTRPDLQVIVRHLQEPLVAEGQDVGVGQAILGLARLTPAERTPTNPEGLPSVWLSVRPATTDDAVDPNRPAVVPTLPSD